MPHDDWQYLITAARQATRRAYCPLSGFPVGAAVETAGGQIFAGCNVENASYGLSLCAERSAVCRAVAEGERDIARVVVFTPTDSPVTPCGACRQVLFEFGPDAEVLCACNADEQIQTTLAELLPRAFRLRIH